MDCCCGLRQHVHYPTEGITFQHQSHLLPYVTATQRAEIWHKSDSTKVSFILMWNLILLTASHDMTPNQILTRLHSLHVQLFYSMHIKTDVDLYTQRAIKY